MSKKNKESCWPLNVSNFTFWDKLKIFKWLCTEKIWTQGDWVRKYEQKWEEYTKCPHVIAVHSGSAANELIALRRKWELKRDGLWEKNKKIAFASNSWISNCSVFINFDFEPIFIDPTGKNFCVTLEDIKNTLDKHPDIGTIFYTSLLGHSANIREMISLCNKRGVKFLMDNCESAFSKDFETDGMWDVWQTHFCNYVTSSVSCYFSHHTSPNQELGLIFCQTDEEADFYRMARNHGMTRGMPDKYKNNKVSPDFDFYLMGSNYRTTNLICYMALLDFDRALEFSKERIKLTEAFVISLDYTKFDYQIRDNGQTMIVPLAIAFSVKKDINRPDLINKIKGYLTAKNIMYRPLIAGWLGFHSAFEKYKLDPKDYPMSVWYNDNAIYLGLHTGVTEKMVRELALELNKL